MENENPVAPESYMPAEAARLAQGAALHKIGCHFPDTPCMCDTITVIDATPVTVEAPERPEWFNFIRVRQRTNLSTKQTDFVASFGPRNILTPEADAETMEQKLEMVKEWLWLFMNKKQ